MAVGRCPLPTHTQERLCPGKPPPCKGRAPVGSEVQTLLRQALRHTGCTQAQNVWTTEPGGHRAQPWQTSAPPMQKTGLHVLAPPWHSEHQLHCPRPLQHQQTGHWGTESQGWSRHPFLLAPAPQVVQLWPHTSVPQFPPLPGRAVDSAAPKLLLPGPWNGAPLGDCGGGRGENELPRPCPAPSPPPLLPLPKRRPGRAPA